MADLDFIVKKEIPFQCLNQDKLQVIVPVHPCLFDLDESIRLDTSIAEQIWETIPDEYNADVGVYISERTQEQIKILGLRDYATFREDWKFSFRKSKIGQFLDLVWEEHENTHELGYISAPVVALNGGRPDGTLCTPEEMCGTYGGNVNTAIWYKDRLTLDLIMFQREKFQIFKRSDVPIFGEIQEEKDYVEVAVHTFCSTWVDNVAQGLVLRNFGVKYLNELVRIRKEIVSNN